MAEAAVATAGAAPIAPTTTAPSAPAPTQTAGATLSSMPTGPDWAASFKNEEVRSYVSKKGFQNPEALAESYKNLEAKYSTRIPEDKMIVLPEKMEGDAARAVYERLGAPKEAKGYELPRDPKADPKFLEKVEGMFHKANLTKTQAMGVLQEYNQMVQSETQAQMTSRQNAIIQGEAKLKGEWGAQYDSNVNLAKQGARILGLDAKTLDLIEMSQGRESLYKTLQKIGVSVGDANFVDGAPIGTSAEMTPDQAKDQIKALIQDEKFGKKLSRGDREAREQWDKLNQLAAPGEFQVR